MPDVFIEHSDGEFVTDGDGNLCWQAAFEQEIASLAVGIRSFPKEGLNAEKYLRDAFIAQLTRLGGQVIIFVGKGRNSTTLFLFMFMDILFLVEYPMLRFVLFGEVSAVFLHTRVPGASVLYPLTILTDLGLFVIFDGFLLLGVHVLNFSDVVGRYGRAVLYDSEIENKIKSCRVPVPAKQHH